MSHTFRVSSRRPVITKCKRDDSAFAGNAGYCPAFYRAHSDRRLASAPVTASINDIFVSCP